MQSIQNEQTLAFEIQIDLALTYVPHPTHLSLIPALSDSVLTGIFDIVFNNSIASILSKELIKATCKGAPRKVFVVVLFIKMKKLENIFAWTIWNFQ